LEFPIKKTFRQCIVRKVLYIIGEVFHDSKIRNTENLTADASAISANTNKNGARIHLDYGNTPDAHVFNFLTLVRLNLASATQITVGFTSSK
jgi:hypothetical protein